jgi:hypothetical protein
VSLSAAYLAIPCLIFLLGWIRPVVGIPAAVVVIAGVMWLAWQKNLRPGPVLTQQNLFLVLAAAFLWTLLVGVGGVLPQSLDYMKHNLLFHDLATCDWPVKYPHAGGEVYLCYSLGYYLVPALAGRLLGVDAIPAAAFMWTFIGLALFFWWAVTLTKSPLKILAAILLFAPIGIFWAFIKAHGIPGVITAAALEPKLVQGGLFFNGFDSFTRFNFQPQHALAGWLGAALLYEMLWVQKNPRGAIFVWGMGVFWSPLSSLGLLLVPLAAWRRTRWQDYFERLNLIAGGVLLVVLGIYFQGHLSLTDQGFIGKFLPHGEWLVFYALFLLLMFAPLLLLWLVERREKILGEMRPLFFVSVAMLLLLPLYKFGIYSDLRLQASGPALMFLAIAAARILESERFSCKRPLHLLLVLSLLAGAVFPVYHTFEKLLTTSLDYSYENLVRDLGWHSMPDIAVADAQYDVASQYLGHGNSVAARWLLRENTDSNP